MLYFLLTNSILSHFYTDLRTMTNWLFPGLMVVLCLITGLVPACEGSPSPSENKYSKYFSLKNGVLVYEAPISGVLNDILNTQKTELKAGDFLRFPQTEETGDILKIIEITRKYSLLEYSHYSAPPAVDRQEQYRFKIYPSAGQ
jgi:hypothetical protein